MNINDLTIGQAKELAAMFGGSSVNSEVKQSQVTDTHEHPEIPVVVCTDKRGVVFGYTKNAAARPIHLKNARMCLYWSADVGGVFGLAESGPSDGCKISAVVPAISLEGVTAIMSVDEKADKAWNSAPVQGR
jgi:hypothetical protein